MAGRELRLDSEVAMSLICAECEFDIEYGTKLFAARSASAESAHALCEECCNKIPSSSRSGAASVKTTGLTVCHADSDRNFNGAYTWTGFTSKEPLFTVTTATALRHLPKISSRLALTDTN